MNLEAVPFILCIILIQFEVWWPNHFKMRRRNHAIRVGSVRISWESLNMEIVWQERAIKSRSVQNQCKIKFISSFTSESVIIEHYHSIHDSFYIDVDSQHDQEDSTEIHEHSNPIIQLRNIHKTHLIGIGNCSCWLSILRRRLCLTRNRYDHLPRRMGSDRWQVRKWKEHTTQYHWYTHQLFLIL